MVSTNQGLGYNQYITTTIDRINGDDVYLTPIETDFEVNWRIPFSKETLIYEGNSPESIVVKPVDPRTWTKDEVKTLFTGIMSLSHIMIQNIGMNGLKRI